MRNILVIDPPEDTPVSLAEAKAHLKVDFDDEDVLIGGLVAAATQFLDGPDGWMGRSLLTQTLELRIDRFDCREIRLPCGPISSIDSVKYLDPDGVQQTLDASNYSLKGSDCVLGFGKAWPSSRFEREAVILRYVAGYGGAVDVPQPIKSAILLHVGHLYANREATTDKALVELPIGADALLSPYRLF